MRQFKVTKNEEGLSVVKLSGKLLAKAPASLIFKFIRNRNIELNGRRTRPEVSLKAGDELSFFLSEETYEKLSGRAPQAMAGEGQSSGGKNLIRELVLYEDDNIILLNKPAGLLSQGAEVGETSLNELLLEYLDYSPERAVIKPSICNRLDKNTSGLIAAGKSAAGLAELNRGFSERYFKKVYCAICMLREGAAPQKGEYRAYLKKDHKTNKALISDIPREGYQEIRTAFSPEGLFDVEAPDGQRLKLCRLNAELITGKPHQIRAHLKFLGFPVLGDRKYFDPLSREISEGLGVKRQLLHSFSLKFHFPEGSVLSYLEGREFAAPLPEDLEIKSGRRA